MLGPGTPKYLELLWEEGLEAKTTPWFFGGGHSRTRAAPWVTHPSAGPSMEDWEWHSGQELLPC